MAYISGGGEGREGRLFGCNFDFLVLVFYHPRKRGFYLWGGRRAGGSGVFLGEVLTFLVLVFYHPRNRGLYLWEGRREGGAYFW